MAQDNFFEEPQNQSEQTQDQAIEKIKLGEKEYTQEQLQKLVGLGEIGLEAEQKYKTRIDRVWPNYQQIVNEKRETTEKLTAAEKRSQDLENQLKQYQSQAQQTQQNQQTSQKQYEAPQLTQEQIREAAVRQARELGIPLNEDVRKIVSEMMQGQQLINDISETIDSMTSDGLPNTTVEDVLNHMQETGIRNPDKAYKDMFEQQWIAQQVSKLAEIKKPAGLPTTSQSVAGSKQPMPESFKNMPVDKLQNMIADSFKEAFQ